MLLRSALAGLGLSTLFLAACSGGGSPGPMATAAPTASPTPVATPTATAAPTACPTAESTGTGVLVCKSSSTNVQGYYFLLQTSGSATITSGGTTTTMTASSSTTSQLFSDLNANTPVANIQTNNGCTKSASFGSTTTVTYEGYSSGDVSCPPQTSSSSTPPATTIYNDVRAVESSLGLQN